MSRKAILLFAAAFVVSCAEMEPNSGPTTKNPQTPPTPVADKSTEGLPGKKAEVGPVKAEQAPAATPRVADGKEADVAKTKISDYFAGHVGRRIYVQIDKPIYKPGETIWFKVWDLKARSLDGDHPSQGMMAELVSPRGSVAQRLRVREEKGIATAAFDVQAGM